MTDKPEMPRPSGRPAPLPRDAWCGDLVAGAIANAGHPALGRVTRPLGGAAPRPDPRIRTR